MILCRLIRIFVKVFKSIKKV